MGATTLSGSQVPEFLALHVTNGRVLMWVNADGTPAVIVSTGARVDDGAWHSVLAVRHVDGSASVTVDGVRSAGRVTAVGTISNVRLHHCPDLFYVLQLWQWAPGPLPHSVLDMACFVKICRVVIACRTLIHSTRNQNCNLLLHFTAGAGC